MVGEVERIGGSRSALGGLLPAGQKRGMTQRAMREACGGVGHSRGTARHCGSVLSGVTGPALSGTGLTHYG